jgi:uncharacterized protein YukE
MELEKIKEIYEEKYQKLLLMDFDEWMDQAPQTEDQAYEILEDIDKELKDTEEEYEQASGDAKWELGEYREMLHNKYQLIEEMFGLEPQDE